MAADTENLEQKLEPYTTVQLVIVRPIATLSVLFLVYGMYVIIFGLSLNVLWRRRSNATLKQYMRCIIVLFVLTNIYDAATTSISISQTLVAFNAVKTKNYGPLQENLSGSSSSAAKLGLSTFSSLFIGIIMDCFLVQRCYVLWGSKKMILYAFAFVVLVVDGMRFMSTAVMIAAYRRQDTALYQKPFDVTQSLVIVTVAYDSILTLMIAGRIWWIHREASEQMASESTTYSKSNLKVIVAAILESGLLYSATLLVAVVVPRVIDPSARGLSPFDPNVMSVQMAAIAPTIMMVRIAYGQAVENVQQVVSTLHFAEGAANVSQQRSMAPGTHGTIDLRRSMAAVDERGSLGRPETEKPLANKEGTVV
ncbi:hypothetical protein PQX77_010007 [Marasmius sp. AFHP31]|nr:hypothetical protein PQX77_010007 [Marasmius sp. AFHP31]